MMGCDRTKKFPIDLVIGTAEACELLAGPVEGSLIVFDEAQYFDPKIVPAWVDASERGADILVGTPSRVQLEALEGAQYELKKQEVLCSCQKRNATHVMYTEDFTYPDHLCDRCYYLRMKEEEKKAAQRSSRNRALRGRTSHISTFFGVDMPGWKLVRNDCSARLNIILDAVERAELVQEKLSDPVKQPSFIDLGCCSGFFSQGMAEQGFRSQGVDVAEHFIDLGQSSSFFKGTRHRLQTGGSARLSQGIRWDLRCVSTFATVQWVMDQRGYEAGIECFRGFF